jgi:ADP-L-glycero-D-manno-heptose 6-epimerase
MRLLITGGAGFIGSRIAKRLAARPDHEILICDRLRHAANGKWRNLLGLPLADVLEPESLLAWLEHHGRGLDAIVHMGAISSTEETDVDRLIAQNFRLSRQIWDWCVGRQKPLIYASSAAVYGDGALGFRDDNHPHAPSLLRPLNPYGWSKQMFDVYALAAQGKGRAPPFWAGLRFFNVYGPFEAHKAGQASVALHLLRRVDAGEDLRLFRSHKAGIADGAQARDFVWVEDCVSVVEWLLDQRIEAGLLNVGTGQARTFWDLAQAVCQATGVNAPIAWIDTPPALRPTYQYHTEADIGRLRLLGFDRAFTSLEAGVAAYAQALAGENR